jgi:hypothetical protein
MERVGRRIPAKFKCFKVARKPVGGFGPQPGLTA